MELIELTLYENIDFHIRGKLVDFNKNMARKTYMKILMDFVEGIWMENKIFAYMRISTTHQKTDRQKQTIIEYSVKNGFNIDEFVFDIITGGTKADNRPNYHNMKEHFRRGDTLIVSDVDRLGRNADDVIVEIKDLQFREIRVVALDVPFLNDWEKMNDDSLSKMIIDIFVTLKAHIAQQEKEKIHDRACTEVSRLSRSTKQLCEILEFVENNKIKLIVGTFIVDCRNDDIDPMTMGMLRMMAVFAQMERDITIQRIKSGMKNAKAKGVRLGRPQTTIETLPYNFLKYYPMFQNGSVNLSELSRLSNISRPTLYKYLKIVEKK